MVTDKTLRDQFMHSSGTTPLETISVIVPSLFYTTITTIIVSIFGTKLKQSTQFCIEFLTLVIPIILNITVLADYSVQVLTTSGIICLSFIFSILYAKPSGVKPEVIKSRDYITNSRATINIISVIAILAVDFSSFPRRFAKTENWGHSLMDVGVGLYVFSNGIVEGGKSDLIKSIKGTIPLLILGSFRFIITNKIDYHVPVSEYGIHWNFFITLAVTKLFFFSISNVVSVKFIWINATLLMISHEILLQAGLTNFVMSTQKRTSFVEANREGLTSSLGYVYLYLFSVYFSYFVDLKKGTNTKKTIWKFCYLSVGSLALSCFFENYFGISRKLANPAYCFWVLFIGIFMTGLYYVMGKILESILVLKLGIGVHLPLIFQAINYNGLAFFLISNVLTGLVNILCDTLKVDTIYSLFIITTYMLINCIVVCVLYKKQIKFKL